MIRLWIVSLIIATNGLHLAFESIQTINFKEDQNWIRESNELSLLQHSTGDQNADYLKNGIIFEDKTLSTDSFLQIFKKNKINFDRSPPKKVIDYFQSLYLAILIVFSAFVYNRFISLKHKHYSHESGSTYKDSDQLDGSKSKQYTVNEVVSDIEISIYCLLPLRTVSRIWGLINSVTLPVHMRKTIFKAYSKSFGCNIDEALEQDFTYYKNLNEFFRRELRPGVRPISTANGVVSPADGTVLHFGKVTNGRVEQVKGITYSLNKFLGPQTWNQNQTEFKTTFDYQKNLLMNKSDIKTELYSCVIYLSPGDYHRFHSPANWKVDFRRHFAGHLLSVRPAFVNGFPEIFTINERVVYSGQWDCGFFSMAAVGATNVGTVKVYFDESLVTNEKHWTSGEYHDYEVEEPIQFNKGEAFGEFNLGSTIVLIFEGPENLDFNVKTGQTVKYGELLAKI